MKNRPKEGGNFTLITEKIEYEYSLDDQCRMEFDEGRQSLKIKMH